MTDLLIQPLHPDFKAPLYATAGAAGFDLHAMEGGSVGPGQIAKIPLGFAVAVPDGYAMLITTRSGHGLKFGAGVPHGYGLIDSDYRGELFMVLCVEKVMQWDKGDRIGQAIVIPVERPNLLVVDTLDTTDRGTGGFGSTGTK
jgi:dUTP pyrophosphatase